jgi:hypothetical protein
MIAETIKLIQLDKFYKVNELVEIAKGECETITLKNLFNKVKRKIKKGK